MNIEIDDVKIADSLRINSEIPLDYQKELRKTFEKVYVLAEKPEKPKTKAELSLKLKAHKAFRFPPRRLDFAEKNDLKNIIDDLLERGVIRVSESECALAVVLTRKKNGKMRMCIDNRTLNKFLESDNYPLPVIDDQILLLKGKKYFSYRLL